MQSSKLRTLANANGSLYQLAMGLDSMELQVNAVIIVKESIVQKLSDHMS